MMGAAWAYESLSFGGYWAWDPVENASLVPWLTLVAGHAYESDLPQQRIFTPPDLFLLHHYFFIDPVFHFFNKKRDIGRYFRARIYRSGNEHAVAAVPAGICCAGIVLYFKNYKSIPSIQKEEIHTAANSGCLSAHSYCS
jgi:cytochrome c-type biogenesis protein CcmF